MCVSMCARVFTIHKKERALQQSEKVGQTSTSEKQQKEKRGRERRCRGRKIAKERMTEESRNWLAYQTKNKHKAKHFFRPVHIL